MVRQIRTWLGRVALPVLALAAPAAAQEQVPAAEAYRIRTEYWRWSPTVDSQFQRGSDGEAGTVIDAKTDLGISDKKAHDIAVTLQFASGHKLRGSYTAIDYSGDVAAGRSFRYGATIYPESARVVTTFKGGYYSADYEFDLVRTQHGFFGGLIGAKLFDFDSIVVAPDLAVRESNTERLPIPVLGATGRMYIGRVSLTGEASGITVGHRGRAFELAASGGLHLSDRLAAVVGYRRLDLKARKQPDGVDLVWGGWRFGVELSL
jgi:hypothetical protein